mgnify:FL=1
MKMITKIFVMTWLVLGIIGCSDDDESKSDIPGCTDPEAINYLPEATSDDGSCEYDSTAMVYGCTDPQAINYLPEATSDDGSCEYDPNTPVYGCIDPLATNYNPNATINDGSCTYNNTPDWEVIPSQFEDNGALAATIEINGIPTGSESDILAGFFEGELRGIAYGLYFELTDKYLFMITLYSNETSGDSISFQFYDESEDQIISLENKVEFISDMVEGNPNDPIVLSGYTSAEDYFSYTQSSQQGFYIIQFAEINGVSLTDEDWIGAFNQSICIGSTTWAGEYTTVPAMGDDGTSFTTGYIVDGEIPQFKIYDASENRYYNALSEGYVDPLEWANNAIINIESLNAETE